jgi:hypothetical protein
MLDNWTSLCYIPPDSLARFQQTMGSCSIGAGEDARVFEILRVAASLYFDVSSFLYKMPYIQAACLIPTCLLQAEYC